MKTFPKITLLKLAPIIALCVLISGCRDQGTVVWSEDVPSPDGQWLATAETKQWGGPGTAQAATLVYLTRKTGSQATVEILDFSGGDAPQPGWPLTIMWTTRSHLEVQYGGHSKVDFQVVRLAGIEISLDDVSNEKPK
jgi:hypothetical protein